MAGAVGFFLVHLCEIFRRLLHGLLLFRAHLVVEVTHCLDMGVAMAHRHVCSLGFAQRAAAPLAYQFLAHTAQHLVQVVVAEALAAAVGIEGARVPQQVVGLVRLRDGVLLVDALPHVGPRRLPDLDPSGKRRVVIHINLRHRTPHSG